MRGYIVDQQHSVSGRQQLVIQRAFFAAALPDTPDDLYARGTEGVVERERQRVAIFPHAKLSTNTLFGRFPASYWQQWTDVALVELDVIAQGSGRISIRSSDITEGARTLATAMVERADGEKVRLLAQVDSVLDGVALWFEASTGAAELVLQSACWSLAKQARRPYVSPHRSGWKKWTITARNSVR